MKIFSESEHSLKYLKQQDDGDEEKIKKIESLDK